MDKPRIEPTWINGHEQAIVTTGYAVNAKGEPVCRVGVVVPREEAERVAAQAGKRSSENECGESRKGE